MQVEKLAYSVDEAAKLLRKYKEHKAHQTPVDAEIERIAGYIAKGKVIIRGAGSVLAAGLGEAKLPKLAIARADQPWCKLFCRLRGAAIMLSGYEWQSGMMAKTRVFEFPADSFPDHLASGQYKALAPHIPPDIRPHRGIENYTLIWEAVWKEEPPVDPILARRIGKSDFFLVVAQWDLTPIERFVLQSRIGRH